MASSFCLLLATAMILASSAVVPATIGRVRRIPATNIAHTVSFSIQTLLYRYLGQSVRPVAK